MKKQWDKLKSVFIINKQITIFLLGLSIIAVVAGAFYITILNKTDQSLVQTSINEFFSKINNNNLNYIASLKNIILTNVGFIIIIWLLGISVIGIPIIIFLFFSKAFVIGFSISSIIFNYKLKGTLLSLFYVFPHHIINIYIFIILIAYAISLSFKIIESIIKRKSIDFKLVMNKYLYVLLVSLIVIVATSLFEIFVMPSILKVILSLVN
ncbi:MAG: stage II sporulation protein M [Bacilli bacterium]|nr:stage II sporulation protein M [Bacilli bacterium]MDD4547838.1 stage II sporulation protein M [Bacilli bacterium]